MLQERENRRFCTTRDLQNMLRSPGSMFVFPHKHWNEVYPGIFIGDRTIALSIRTLKEIGITHVLNVAQGSDTFKGFVSTDSSYYNHEGIDYKGFPAIDDLSFDLSQYFLEAADFIENVLKSKGKVLVHCYQGVSRSATLVLAFLMLKRGMTAKEAIKIVRSKREINPNSNFLQLLCDLNRRLQSNCKY